MKIAFVFLPLAFNGPCISESGPKVMEFFLKKIIIKEIITCFH